VSLQEAFEDGVDLFGMGEWEEVSPSVNANVGSRPANRQQPIVRSVNVQCGFVEDCCFFRQSAAKCPIEHHPGESGKAKKRCLHKRLNDWRMYETANEPREAQEKPCPRSQAKQPRQSERRAKPHQEPIDIAQSRKLLGTANGAKKNATDSIKFTGNVGSHHSAE